MESDVPVNEECVVAVFGTISYLSYVWAVGIQPGIDIGKLSP